MSGPSDLQELSDLVADARDLAEAWAGVGARRIPWDGRGPAWPALPLGAGESPPVPPPARGRPPAALFPDARPLPRPVPPTPPPPGAVSRWQGYGGGLPRGAALDRLRSELGACQRCGLSRSRTHLVFGVGDPEAALAVVGEAPGYHEDKQGEPFVGPAGEMLDKMLQNVLGLRREAVYIMNVLKCRPPENRDPHPDEMTACRPCFDAQLGIVRPRVVLALGRFAAQSLLDSPQGIKALRGRWGLYRGVPVMPTFHPAYLLRQPEEKRLTLQDLLEVKKRLGGG